jgi:ATP-dependent Clp protease ATP-binding subunit ClpA
VLNDLGVDEEAIRAEVAVLSRSDSDALRAIGIDLDQVRRRAEEAFGPGALERPVDQRRGWFGRGRGRRQGGHLRFNKDARTLLERSLREALALKHNYIGTEHMLLAVVAAQRSAAAGVLRRLGVTASHDDVKARVLAEISRAA